MCGARQSTPITDHSPPKTPTPNSNPNQAAIAYGGQKQLAALDAGDSVAGGNREMMELMEIVRKRREEQQQQQQPEKEQPKEESGGDGKQE